MMKYLIGLLLTLGVLIYFMASSVSTTMDVRDKIGQMLFIGFDGQSVNAQSSIVKTIQDNNIGGVILFDFNHLTNTFDKNIKDPAQVEALNTALQDFNHVGHLAHHRVDLPLFIAVDYEGGEVNRLGPQYGFPFIPSAAQMGHQCVVNVDNVALKMAETLKRAHFNFNFAPVLDVNLDPNSPIIGKINRSFSDDPIKVSHYAELFSRHFLAEKIQCAYKHFPGHGSAKGDSHLGFVDVTQTWQPKELEPYQLLLNHPSSCGAVMTAHVVNRQLDDTGLPATLSHKILTGLLREKLHFQGVIISDDMQMKAIRDHYGLKEALTLAINAGVDMLIVANALPGEPDDPEMIIQLIEDQVKAGAISPARIDDAYQRIIQLKKTIQ